jgi:hypothetical protein
VYCGANIKLTYWNVNSNDIKLFNLSKVYLFNLEKTLFLLVIKIKMINKKKL